MEGAGDTPWRWWAVVVGVVVLVGGGVLALRGGGGDGDEAATTGSTAVVTTTTAAPVPTSAATTMPPHEHAPGEDGMPHEEPSAGTPGSAPACASDFGGSSSGPATTVAAPAGQAAAFGPPSSDCHETGTGCVVSFALRWSDGHVEGGTRTLDQPGEYTVEGDRGARATFAVTPSLACTPPAITYNTLWGG
jgi:hypothetical protein